MTVQAGQWIQEDPGPWLGRAVIFKMNVSFHRDVRDDGPVVTFPVGAFKGSEMEIPQLLAYFL